MSNVPVWTCSNAAKEQTNLFKFWQWLSPQIGVPIHDYEDLRQWSVDNTGEFWSKLWDYCEIIGDKGEALNTGTEAWLTLGKSMLEQQFFPNASLNFAENLLDGKGANNTDKALVFWGEDRVKNHLSWQQLREQTSKMAQALVAAGIEKNDRIAAFVPNIPEAVVGMLAAASIGAVWSSCSPDFGEQGVLDRFGQIEPKLLIAADGYFYSGKVIDNLSKLEGIASKLTSVKQVLVVPYMRLNTGEKPTCGKVVNAQLWDDFVASYEPQPMQFAKLPFNHPLYILYSSGTTGVPKCIVHSIGGTLLQHLKEHCLQNDVKPNDRVFYFTTCTWMMWNWLVSGLAAGASILLYDGSPFYPNADILFDLAEQEKMTHFGTSAKYIDTLKNRKLDYSRSHNLNGLRVLNSTGSPLLPENHDFVYSNIKADIYVASMSGGTDIVSCFVLGNPTADVYRGEIPCRGLGMAVEIWNDDGQSIEQEKGELVCVKAFPCMPIGFWNDEGNKRYKAAYFERFDGIWMQGDFAEITKNKGVIIYGRSDATLNPGGVRIGTAEIYRQVELIAEVEESVVIGQPINGDVRVVLFVVLNSGYALDQALIARIKLQIRTGATPRHVPAIVIAVDAIPRTKSGKISELAVADVVAGRRVKNTTALANPESLKHYENCQALTIS